MRIGVADIERCARPKSGNYNDNKEFYLRMAVISCLICAAGLCGTGSYYLLYNLETRLLNSQYQTFNKQFANTILDTVQDRVEALDILTLFVGSQCPYEESWPNCAVEKNTWKLLTNNIISLGGNRAVGYVPILDESHLASFEEFALKTFNESSDAAKFRSTLWWNVGLWTMNASNVMRHVVDASFAQGERDIVVPVFEVSDPEENIGALLFDLYSEVTRATAIDKAIRCYEDKGYGGLDECTTTTDIITVIADTSTIPAAILVRPILPRLNTSTVVGLGLSLFAWDDIFEGAIASNIAGIDAVLESLVNPASPGLYSFRFDYGSVKSTGPGDNHDSKYAYMQKKVDVCLHGAGDVLFRVHIYPNDSFFRVYRSWGPWFASVVSVSLILLTSLIFYQYDVLMKRQKKDNLLIMNTRRQFVRYISHEIRTPLNTLYLGMQVLLDELSDLMESRGNRQLPDDVNSAMTNWLGLVSDMTESADAAVYVLNDLVSYDRISLGSYDINTAYHNIWDILAAAVKPFRVQAHHSGVHLITEFDIDVKMEDHKDHRGRNCTCVKAVHSLMVNGDKLKLEKVISNLLGNALNVTAAGGHIVISGIA